MIDDEKMKFFTNQLEQQERLVSQLVEIVANTNKKVKLLEEQIDQLKTKTHG